MDTFFRVSRLIVFAALAVVDAAVLGKSLKQTGTRHDLLLLHTDEIPAQWLTILRSVGWQLRLVDYLKGESLYNGSQNNRFEGVFTKLHAVGLTEYDKIVMLDVDLLVRQEGGHLIRIQSSLCPPATCEW